MAESKYKIITFKIACLPGEERRIISHMNCVVYDDGYGVANIGASEVRDANHMEVEDIDKMLEE